MRAARFVFASLILAGVAGCGSGGDPAMPNVAGKKLDVALGDIERAGFDDKVDVVGGGVFGIVDKSNWEVCKQTPGPGKPMAEKPRLQVERQCSTDKAEPSVPSEPSEEPSPEPEPPSPSQTTTPAGAVAAAPVLTIENSPELAALLKVGDGCDDVVAPFARKYAGRNIRFNGSIAALVNHGNYRTRYDILVFPGDQGPKSTRGPNLQFKDVGIVDLKLSGNVPDALGPGDLLGVTAQVGEYNPTQCLLRLKPVKTQVR